MALRPDLKTFPELSYHAFQHPADSQAIAALQNVPGLPRVVRFLSEHSIERVILIDKVSSNLRVNAKQYPSLYRQYLRMAEVLDVRKLPALYIETTNTINAYAMGIENYTIVLCSGLLDIMDEDEMMAILGHELGHVKCDHQLYKTLAYLLTNFGSEIIKQMLPVVGSFLSLGLQLAILDWNRKAELSCDRAALLAVQSAGHVSSALGKLAGFSNRYATEFNVDEIDNQAREYHELGDDSMITKMLKIYSMMQNTHPYPVVRVREIRQWAAGQEFKNIMSGNYARGNRVVTHADRVSPSVETPRARRCPNDKCRTLSAETTNFCVHCQTNLRLSKLVCARCHGDVEPASLACSCGNRFDGVEIGA